MMIIIIIIIIITTIMIIIIVMIKPRGLEIPSLAMGQIASSPI